MCTNLYFYFYVLYSLANLFNSIVKVPLCFASQNKGGMWKELSKCLDDVFVQMFGRKITTSTLSSCTCSFEGQATLNEYVRCGLYSKK